MNKQDKIKFTIFALSAIAYFPFSQWMATARFGTWVFLWGQMVYLFPLLAAILAFPVLIVGLCFKKTRAYSIPLLMLIAIFLPCCIFGLTLGQKVRTEGMRAFGQRSNTLIKAISAYERDHSTPPSSLADLVPKYLPAIPSTGMLAYPRYRYHTGVEAQEQYANNPWALTVDTPSGGINFDMMMYFPNQNYPDSGYGGFLERIDTWAYVHE